MLTSDKATTPALHASSQLSVGLQSSFAKKTFGAIRFALFFLAATKTAQGLAAEVDNPWLIRARAVHMNMSNQSAPINALNVPADAIHIENRTIPEVDITYFFTPNWAAELVLTVPQRHDVSLHVNGNSTALGNFQHLPPTLSVQYHFAPKAKIQPYIGAGINYTQFHDVKLSAGASLPLELEDDSIGLSYGAGVDFVLNKKWSLNVDVKKLQIRSDVLLNGNAISSVKADPLLIGIGIGYRF